MLELFKASVFKTSNYSELFCRSLNALTIVFCSFYSRMEKKTIRRFGRRTKWSKWKATLKKTWIELSTPRRDFNLASVSKKFQNHRRRRTKHNRLIQDNNKRTAGNGSSALLLLWSFATLLKLPFPMINTLNTQNHFLREFKEA